MEVKPRQRLPSVHLETLARHNGSAVRDGPVASGHAHPSVKHGQGVGPTRTVRLIPRPKATFCPKAIHVALCSVAGPAYTDALTRSSSGVRSCTSGIDSRPRSRVSNSCGSGRARRREDHDLSRTTTPRRRARVHRNRPAGGDRVRRSRPGLRLRLLGGAAPELRRRRGDGRRKQLDSSNAKARAAAVKLASSNIAGSNPGLAERQRFEPRRRRRGDRQVRPRHLRHVHAGRRHDEERCPRRRPPQRDLEGRAAAAVLRRDLREQDDQRRPLRDRRQRGQPGGASIILRWTTRTRSPSTSGAA